MIPNLGFGKMKKVVCITKSMTEREKSAVEAQGRIAYVDFVTRKAAKNSKLQSQISAKSDAANP